MEIGVNSFHIRKVDLLPEDHLVEGADEKSVKESSMEDSQTDNTSNEFEVIQMLWVDARVGIDLKSVVVVGGVFEKAVERIKHFVRQQEEEFSAKGLALETDLTSFTTHLERPP